MKDVFLVYHGCCFYEITVLSYFMSFSHCDTALCSLDGKPVRAMEGFSVNADLSLANLPIGQLRSFILPGGSSSEIDCAEVRSILRHLNERNVLIAGICAGVDVLEHAGLLHDVRSTHTVPDDLVHDKNVITARANAYVDFAIETAMTLGLFTGEEDLQETIRFWKERQNIQ